MKKLLITAASVFAVFTLTTVSSAAAAGNAAGNILSGAGRAVEDVANGAAGAVDEVVGGVTGAGNTGNADNTGNTADNAGNAGTTSDNAGTTGNNAGDTANDPTGGSTAGANDTLISGTADIDGDGMPESTAKNPTTGVPMGDLVAAGAVMLGSVGTAFAARRKK